MGEFSGAVVWLAGVGGMPAAIVGDPVHRIVGIPGSRRFVAEIERGWDLFGDRANLWLYDLA